MRNKRRIKWYLLKRYKSNDAKASSASEFSLKYLPISDTLKQKYKEKEFKFIN